MPKSVQRLNAFTLNLFPLVLLVLDAALEHVSESFLAIVASVDVDAAIPEHHGVISSLAGHVTTLQRAHIIPLLLGQIVIEEVFVEVATLLLVASKEVELAVIADALGPRSRQWYLSLARQ